VLDEGTTPKVAMFCDHYLPGFRAGGPVVSLSRIVSSETNARIRVITRNSDKDSLDPYGGVKVRSWTPCGRARVAYLRPGITDWIWLACELRRWDPDVLYVNSLHSPYFALIPLLLRKMRVMPHAPLMLHPRGEASPGALRIKSKKKTLARPFIRLLVGKKVLWHASSDIEKSNIEQWWGGTLPRSHRVLVHSDPPPSPAEKVSFPTRQPAMRILFASRLHPTKGLDELLQALQSVDERIELHIRGVIGDESYWRKCQGLISKVPPNVHVVEGGPYSPEESGQLAAQADLFVLPTRGEGFGHAIAESLAVGCPTVISPNTMWSDVARCGGYVVANRQDLAHSIRAVAVDDEATRRTRRLRTLQAYRDWYESRQDLSSLFQRFGRSEATESTCHSDSG